MFEEQNLVVKAIEAALGELQSGRGEREVRRGRKSSELLAGTLGRGGPGAGCFPRKLRPHSPLLPAGPLPSQGRVAGCQGARQVCSGVRVMQARATCLVTAPGSGERECGED